MKHSSTDNDNNQTFGILDIKSTSLQEIPSFTENATIEAMINLGIKPQDLVVSKIEDIPESMDTRIRIQILSELEKKRITKIERLIQERNRIVMQQPKENKKLSKKKTKKSKKIKNESSQIKSKIPTLSSSFSPQNVSKNQKSNLYSPFSDAANNNSKIPIPSIYQKSPNSKISHEKKPENPDDKSSFLFPTALSNKKLSKKDKSNPVSLSHGSTHIPKIVSKQFSLPRSKTHLQYSNNSKSKKSSLFPKNNKSSKDISLEQLKSKSRFSKLEERELSLIKKKAAERLMEVKKRSEELEEIKEKKRIKEQKKMQQKERSWMLLQEKKARQLQKEREKREKMFSSPPVKNDTNIQSISPKRDHFSELRKKLISKKNKGETVNSSSPSSSITQLNSLIKGSLTPKVKKPIPTSHRTPISSSSSKIPVLHL